MFLDGEFCDQVQIDISDEFDPNIQHTNRNPIL